MATRKSSKKSATVSSTAQLAEKLQATKTASMAPVMSSSGPSQWSRMSSAAANSPYSLTAFLQFLFNNAGLIFIALSIFIVGFIAGSLWTENQLLKKGVAQAAAAPAPAAQQQAQGQDNGPTTLSDADWQSVLATPAFVIGNKDAKVTMVEFTDYQCPFCGQFFNQSYSTIKKNYLDAGKVKLVIHDQPLPFHPNSRIGALAARCAGDQGKYEDMHDTLFGKQADWVDLAKDDAINKFGDYATAMGINGNTLKDCVKTEKFGKEVDADIALAGKVGANGTPTFFIEKQPIVGAQPTGTFTAALDKAVGQ